MKKKINWGNVGWGVCFALNVISAVCNAIAENWNAVSGLGIALLFLFKARLTEAECDFLRTQRDIWYKSSEKYFDRSLELAKEIKKLKKQLEMESADGRSVSDLPPHTKETLR